MITGPTLWAGQVQKILVKELGFGNICLLTRLAGIMTAHDFDMWNIGLSRNIMKKCLNQAKKYFF